MDYKKLNLFSLVFFLGLMFFFMTESNRVTKKMYFEKGFHTGAKFVLDTFQCMITEKLDPMPECYLAIIEGEKYRQVIYFQSDSLIISYKKQCRIK